MTELKKKNPKELNMNMIFGFSPRWINDSGKTYGKWRITSELNRKGIKM